MTETPIVVVGDSDVVAALRTAGVTDAVTLELTVDQAVLGSVFDDATDTWALSTSDGRTCQARIVIDAHRSPFVPWIPEIAGRSDYQGESFHAAAPDPDFDPAGKRIAVVGTDAAAGHYISGLIGSAKSVTAFAHPPRRFVTELPLPRTRVRRWLGRHILGTQPRSAAQSAGAAISALTASGIRTSDGVEWQVDAIVYGTGCALADHVGDQRMVAGGRTLRQAWEDGAEPFFGVAVHGFPNYFFITGPDIGAQVRYLVECIALMRRTDSTRIEVRHSSQQVFNERAQLGPAQRVPVASGFDLTSTATDGVQSGNDTYDGDATLEIAGTRRPVRVRLTGHLDPLDGNYHWQGTVFTSLPQDLLAQARAATLTVGQRSASARIVEQTPWGTHSVAGVGAPPYDRSS